MTVPDAADGIRTGPLLPVQRDVLRQALADAVFYRDPPVYCPDCETPDRLCRRCAAGLSQARAYLAVSRELQISPAGLEHENQIAAAVTGPLGCGT